ncbi:ArsR/SmtB family transcription factor [Scleromatobacter humisilvae]|uniref:Metalloregulator ArsR/SmtB family transcription factor n=1 Tax=Scleromatobacter humisilvae TaxID=2897159 RepID=A0A9X1YKZ8_9BURK|nr:metalloregulator ArsR/SmtB family transcription factor [Scleromatobacter humisilvae]MCK9686830.1 metalloregulator ArsR/SmtB family transcription factor [Scleromatobacter humisilvae]
MLQHQTLDRVFQALSDPSRRAIVDRLSQGDASVSELAKPFAMSLAAVVQHIQLLEASGLIRTQKTGRVRSCHLDRDVLSQAETWLSQRRAMWEGNLDRLGEVLAQQKAERARAAACIDPTKTTPATPRRQRKPT